MRSRGVLVQDGEYATLTFQRTYRHTLSNVWDAIATPEGLSEWLLCTFVRIDGRVGGKIELVSGPAAYRSTGTILVWDPPNALEYEWNVGPAPEMPHGEHAIFRYDLTPVGDSTQLLVTYRRLTMSVACGFLPGLHAFLDRLEAQLDGCPLPDWPQRFEELSIVYPEWTGHAPAPSE